MLSRSTYLWQCGVAVTRDVGCWTYQGLRTPQCNQDSSFPLSHKTGHSGTMQTCHCSQSHTCSYSSSLQGMRRVLLCYSGCQQRYSECNLSYSEYHYVTQNWYHLTDLKKESVHLIGLLWRFKLILNSFFLFSKERIETLKLDRECIQLQTRNVFLF